MGLDLKRRLHERRERRAAEFLGHIGALLENEQVKRLGDFIQHRCGTRLQHCVDVAYYSFLVARLFGWDSKSTARAGLLHDLFHYDRHSKGMKVKRHWRRHPQIALQNAREVCELNKIEEDIIKRHMWLITLRPPRYREGYVVTFVDKYCALREFARGIFKKAA